MRVLFFWCAVLGVSRRISFTSGFCFFILYFPSVLPFFSKDLLSRQTANQSSTVQYTSLLIIFCASVVCHACSLYSLCVWLLIEAFAAFCCCSCFFFSTAGKNSESKKKKERTRKRKTKKEFDRKRCELETVCRMLFIVVLLWMAEVYLSPFARLVIFYMSSMRACVDGASRGGCESERNEP